MFSLPFTLSVIFHCMCVHFRALWRLNWFASSNTDGRRSPRKSGRSYKSETLLNAHIGLLIIKKRKRGTKLNLKQFSLIVFSKLDIILFSPDVAGHCLRRPGVARNCYSPKKLLRSNFGVGQNPSLSKFCLFHSPEATRGMNRLPGIDYGCRIKLLVLEGVMLA